jgi:hypothetical protein
MGLENNESNSALVSLDKISTTSALGFITITCGDEAYIGSNSREACAGQPKLTKLSGHEYITRRGKHTSKSHLLSIFVSVARISVT